MPKVSVIIPIYGVEKYIEKCARSLFEQTLEDIEFIFVDDCTPDKSVEILNSVISSYPKRSAQVKIVKHETNKGLPFARETGLSYATGDYIIHCDSDDWVEPQMYEALYNKAIDENADIVICDYYYAYSDGKRVVLPQKPAATDGKMVIKQMLFQQLHGSCCNKLVKRACYNTDIVFPKENMREDLALMVQLVYYAKKVAYLPQAYYNYYFNTNSLSQSLSYEVIEKRVLQSVKNYQIVEDFLNKKGLSTEFRDGLAMVRFAIKNSLALNTNTKRGQALWKSTFPDITIVTVLGLKTKPIFKIQFILASLSVFTLVRRLRHLWKKCL